MVAATERTGAGEGQSARGRSTRAGHGVCGTDLCVCNCEPAAIYEKVYINGGSACVNLRVL